MKKRPRANYQERDDDSLLTYGRPSASAWLAAAAVAFAVFVLGGFIRTHRQLETVKEESAREIAELRDSIRRLREDRAAMAASLHNDPSRRQPRLQNLPPARQGYADGPRYDPPPIVPNGGAPARPAALRPEQNARQYQTETAASGIGLFDDIQGVGPAERPRYQLGRTFEGDDDRLLTVAGDPCQVISVSNDLKRLIVEGGRDLGLTEGSRLELRRDGRWAADLRILDVYDNQSACEVLHATVQPQPGDTVRRAPK